MTAIQEGILLPQNRAELSDSFRSANKPVDRDSFEIITGRGNIPLAEKVGELLDKPVDQPCSNFADGETAVQITPNLRGREVFIIQSMSPQPNDRVQEVVLMGDAAKRGSSENRTAILPYVAYSRQDRKSKSRTPISIAAVAKQLEYVGNIGRVFTIDLHAEQSEGTFSGAWDNVFASKVLIPAISSLNLKDTVVVSPDTGSAKRAEKFHEKLGIDGDIAIVYKKRDLDLHDHSKALAITGDVKDKDVVIVDDIMGTGHTTLNAAELLKQKGARTVIAAATHALLVPDKEGITLPERLHNPNSPIDRLLITDTIFQKEEVRNHSKIDVISVAPMLAVAILCCLTRDSIGQRLIE